MELLLLGDLSCHLLSPSSYVVPFRSGRQPTQDKDRILEHIMREPTPKLKHFSVFDLNILFGIGGGGALGGGIEFGGGGGVKGLSVLPQRAAAQPTP